MSTFGILLFTVTPGFIVAIVVLVVIIALFIVLYILGKKAQKKQDEQ